MAGEIAFNRGFRGLPDGIVSAPAIAFSAETNTGLYRDGVGSLNIAVLGRDIVNIQYVASSNTPYTIAFPNTINLQIPSGNVVALRIADITTNSVYYHLDTTLVGVNPADIAGMHYFQTGPNNSNQGPSFPANSSNSFSLVNFTTFTAYVTGTTAGTTLDGMMLNVNTPFIQTGATITRASSIYIAGAPAIGLGGGSITTALAIDIHSGAIGLAGSAGTTGQVLTSQGPGSTPIWQTDVESAVPWSALTNPTAALNLTMPAGDETSFTIQSTTQTGFTWSSSTLTTGVIAAFTQTSTALTAATHNMVTITSSGVNGTASVIAQGLAISVTNTGTTNTNTALTLTATGGSTDNIALAATGKINLNVSQNFNTNINTGNSTGTVTIGNSQVGAISIQAKSNTASAFVIGDGSFNQYVFDSRTGALTGVTHTFQAENQSYSSGSGRTYSVMTTAGVTMTFTGTTTVNSMSGFGLLIQAGVVTDASAVAITSISQFAVQGPVPSGSVTFTNSMAIDVPTFATNGTAASGLRVAAPTGATGNFAINVASGAIGLAGSAGTNGQVLTSGGANSNCTWTTISASTRWDQIGAPTAALSLTMPAGDETTFTVQSTTQIGFFWSSSTITSGTIIDVGLSGSSAVAGGATLGTIAHFSSNAVGFATGTTSLMFVGASGVNNNASVVLQGISISMTNTGTTNTNTALRLNASGASTNWAIFIAAGNVGLASSGLVRPNAGVCGYSVNTTTLTLGSAGSIIIPEADMGNAANDAARDVLAGNVNGAMAADTLGVAGVFKIWFRVGGAWKSATIA